MNKINVQLFLGNSQKHLFSPRGHWQNKETNSSSNWWAREFVVFTQKQGWLWAATSEIPCPGIVKTHKSNHWHPKPSQLFTTYILAPCPPNHIIWVRVCTAGSREGTGVCLDSKVRSSWEGLAQMKGHSCWFQGDHGWGKGRRDGLVLKCTGCSCTKQL